MARTTWICCGSRITLFDAMKELDFSLGDGFFCTGPRGHIALLKLFFCKSKPILSGVKKHGQSETDLDASKYAAKGTIGLFFGSSSQIGASQAMSRSS